MNFLALDTSGGYLTVVAYKNGEFFSTHLPDCAMKQSTLVMGAVDETLQKAGMQPQDFVFFSAVVGAGSFTGIRIGISVAKGFALAHNKPTLPVTSFEVMAYNKINGKTLTLVDALHGSFYACGFEDGKQVLAPSFLEEAQVLDWAKNEGAVLLALSPLPLDGETEIVDAVAGLQRAVLAKAERGEFGELNALYVRKSSAEENLAK